ncbi:MAG: 2-dehydropantoate 2-reductase [Acidobacteria bacterium]|nr:2-dehydropantoate 2-reductase [Acidobacteriota bacterium]
MTPLRFAIVGSGAVGGYCGARLAQSGAEVTFVARGAHLAALRERGLSIRSPLGDLSLAVRAEQDAARVPPVDVAIFAVKAYSNDEAVPLLAAVARDRAIALTLQNGVDSVDALAAAIGSGRVLGGSAYVATALAAPGRIEQTGTHQRIVFGEVFGQSARVSDRVRAIHEAFLAAGIESEAVADARAAIWEKFCYLSPFAGFTGAARVPIGPLWSNPATRETILAGCREVEAVAAAEGVALAPGLIERIAGYVSSIPASTRSSLLIDLQQGKPIEVEALLGSVVRRGARAGVPTPIASALYAVLAPHARPAARPD